MCIKKAAEINQKFIIRRLIKTDFFSANESFPNFIKIDCLLKILYHIVINIPIILGTLEEKCIYILNY